MKINKKSNISNVIKSSKKVISVLDGYDLDCHMCKGSVQDTVEIVATNHGLDLQKFLADLNNAVK